MRRPSWATPFSGLDRLTVLCRITSSHKQQDKSIDRAEPDDGHSRRFAGRTHLAVGMQLTPNRGGPRRDSHWGH